MSERELDSLLEHLRRKLSKFVGRMDIAWQVEIHGKGGSQPQVRVTEIDSPPKCGAVPLEERR